MERDEIIKALECCKSFRDFYMCDICPYYRLELADDENCTNRLSQDALALIKELTEENERLLTALAKYDQQTEVRIAEEYYTAEAYEELREENERLHAQVKMWTATAYCEKDRAESSKADTVRKMHSLIKERCIAGGIYPAFVASTIEKVAKELSGE